MKDGLEVHGDVSPRHDPYRYWVTGILFELGVFAGFAVVVLAMTVVLALLFRG